MMIGTMRVKLYASWVHSLKEKRMIVKSICSKMRNKFNISIAEIDEQDTHQTIVVGIACIAHSVNQANSILDNTINFIEGNTEAEIVDIEREII